MRQPVSPHLPAGPVLAGIATTKGASQAQTVVAAALYPSADFPFF